MKPPDKYLPADAQETLQEHKELQSTIQRIAERLGTDPVSEKDDTASWCIADLRGLRSDIEVLRVQLSEHFRREEEGGFFADLVRRLPERAAEIDRVRREHEWLSVRIDHIAAGLCHAEEPTGPHLRFARRVRELLDDLAAHECHEEELLLTSQGEPPQAAD